VGGEDVSYGSPPPKGKTWKQIFTDEVRARIADVDWTRVRFLGRLPYEQYLAVMRLSTVHVYLTYPFVLSWSLIEAMGLGRAIVASDTPPVREVLSHDVTARLVNFFDVKALTKSVLALLDDPSARERLGQAAAALAEQRYDLQRVCLPAQQAMLAGIIPAWTNSKPSSPLLPSPSKAA
jgi:glycosyltransferase involved in cell wall biosynthesis